MTFLSQLSYVAAVALCINFIDCLLGCCVLCEVSYVVCVVWICGVWCVVCVMWCVFWVFMVFGVFCVLYAVGCDDPLHVGTHWHPPPQT